MPATVSDLIGLSMSQVFVWRGGLAQNGASSGVFATARRFGLELIWVELRARPQLVPTKQELSGVDRLQSYHSARTVPLRWRYSSL